MDEMIFSVEDKDVLQTIAKIEALLSSEGMSVFLGATLGPYLSKRAKERFQNEGDDVSGPWAALSNATISIREEAGFGAGPINHRTGQLEDWVVDGGWNAYPTGFGASMRYPKREPSGELRSKLETAQIGKKHPDTPARRVLGVNEADLLFLSTALAGAIEAAGR